MIQGWRLVHAWPMYGLGFVFLVGRLGRYSNAAEQSKAKAERTHLGVSTTHSPAIGRHLLSPGCPVLRRERSLGSYHCRLPPLPRPLPRYRHTQPKRSSVPKLLTFLLSTDFPLVVIDSWQSLFVPMPSTPFTGPRAGGSTMLPPCPSYPILKRATGRPRNFSQGPSQLSRTDSGKDKVKWTSKVVRPKERG